MTVSTLPSPKSIVVILVPVSLSISTGQSDLFFPVFHLAIELVRQWQFIASTQCSTRHRYSSTSQLQQESVLRYHAKLLDLSPEQ